MLTAEDYYKWRREVNDYAELQQGLDPIGAGDMLTDLARFCAEEFIARLDDGAESLPDPETTWELFRLSNFWSKYYPPAYDYEH